MSSVCSAALNCLAVTSSSCTLSAPTLQVTSITNDRDTEGDIMLTDVSSQDDTLSDLICALPSVTTFTMCCHEEILSHT